MDATISPGVPRLLRKISANRRVTAVLSSGAQWSQSADTSFSWPVAQS